MRGRPRKDPAEKARQPRKQAVESNLEQTGDVTVYGGAALLPEHKPKFLKKRAREIWDCQLSLSPQLRACDALLFGNWCLLAAETERLQEDLGSKGFMIRNANNTRSRREEVGLLHDLQAELLKLATALGFTPYARKQQGIVLKLEPLPDANKTTRKGVIDTRRKAAEVGFVVPPRPRS